jgi:hypothetical protein
MAMSPINSQQHTEYMNIVKILNFLQLILFDAVRMNNIHSILHHTPLSPILPCHVMLVP